MACVRSMARRHARPPAFRVRDEDAFLSDSFEAPAIGLVLDAGDGSGRDAGPGEDGSSKFPLK
jgi:hypothetical protein